MLIEHKSLEISVDLNKDFSQKQLEQYEEELLEKSKELRSGSAFNRIMIESAQSAKILENLKGNLSKPSVVMWLTLKVRAAIDEAKVIPPE